MKRKSLKLAITTKVSRSRKEVFLRSDFERLGGYDQVGRALKQLTDEGALLKIGYGLDAKARPSRLSGEPVLAAPGGFAQVAQEALQRLRVQWHPFPSSGLSFLHKSPDQHQRHCAHKSSACHSVKCKVNGFRD